MVHDLFEADAYETMADVLSDRPPTVILDVGAHVGASCDRMLEIFSESQLWAFEPVQATFDQLSNRFAGNPRVETCRSAVGRRNGIIEILVNQFADTSSALSPTQACRRYHGDKVREVRREQARIIGLDDWAEQLSIDCIGAMKIDVQGLELDVLCGAENLLRTTITAVISEAELAPIYEGAATFSEIDIFLRECGFVLHQVCRIASGGAEQRTTCCDALWVRTDVHHAYVERVNGLTAATMGSPS